MLKIKYSKYLLVGILLIPDILAFLLMLIYGIDFMHMFGPLFIPIILWNLPIMGVLKEKQWAYFYIWFIVTGLLFISLLALGMGNDSGEASVSNVLITFAIFIMFVVILSYVNIIFGRYLKNSKIK